MYPKSANSTRMGLFLECTSNPAAVEADINSAVMQKAPQTKGEASEEEAPAAETAKGGDAA